MCENKCAAHRVDGVANEMLAAHAQAEVRGDVGEAREHREYR